MEAVVLAPGQGAQPRHADGHMGEGVDHGVVAAEGTGQVARVEDVGDDRGAAAALDDGDTGVAARDACDLVPGGDERLHSLLAEHSGGTGDRDPHADLLLRAASPDPRTDFPGRHESRGPVQVRASASVPMDAQEP